MIATKLNIFCPFGVHAYEHNNNKVSYLTEQGYWKMVEISDSCESPDEAIQQIESLYAAPRKETELTKAFKNLYSECCRTEKSFWGTNYHTKNGSVETEYGTIRCDSICVEKGSPTKCCTYVPEFTFIAN